METTLLPDGDVIFRKTEEGPARQSVWTKELLSAELKYLGKGVFVTSLNFRNNYQHVKMIFKIFFQGMALYDIRGVKGLDVRLFYLVATWLFLAIFQVFLILWPQSTDVWITFRYTQQIFLICQIFNWNIGQFSLDICFLYLWYSWYPVIWCTDIQQGVTSCIFSHSIA